MPVRSMTLTTVPVQLVDGFKVSDACQINDFDHLCRGKVGKNGVSDACQINDFDHLGVNEFTIFAVSDACQINDFDHKWYC